MYQELKVWTMRREEFEADSRDFLVENTVGWPTEEDIKNMPAKIDLLPGLPRTYNQLDYGSCTAHALTHVQLFNNCKDFESALVDLDPRSLWANMWHDPKNKNDSWDYLENALKTAVEKWISGKAPSGKTMNFVATNYSFRRLGDLNTDDINALKYCLFKWYPLYTAIKWWAKTWREIANWELLTIYNAWKTDGWHAVSIFGIDENYIYFANSRTPVAWETKSWFKISIERYREMLKQSMCSWRYRVVYDKKDITTPPLFEDYYKEVDTEEYKAIKWCKDIGLIKWSNWKLLPNEPLTREQMWLLFYRFATFIWWGTIKSESVENTKPIKKIK